MVQSLETIRTTCPRDCYDACGMIIVKREDKIVRVKGDPEHFISRGSLCGKCSLAYNSVWLDPNQRLTQPLRRMGKKGEGQFVSISWNDAIAAIADKLQPILATSASSTILQTHYRGTNSLIAGSFPLRFFNRIGATEVDPSTICDKAGHAALNLTFGDSEYGFDPRTAKDATCILIWGANPSHSAPHIHRYWLKEFSGKVIVIDPVCHSTAAQADLHLQPFPGTDAALAFCFLHIFQKEGLLDNEFLDNFTVGWHEIIPLLPQCTPEWGEAVTGIPANLIETAAKIYGSSRSLLWLGIGLQRQLTGGNVIRACSLVAIATGNIGKPGTGFLYVNGLASRGIDTAYLYGSHLNPDNAQSISHMDLASCLEDSERSKVLFCWNNNIVVSGAQQQRLRNALKREDLFTISLELFRTDTTDYADIVLPAASFLEFDDLLAPYFNYTIAAQVKAIDPLGESLSNQEIFRQLAAAIGFQDPELFESDRSIIDTLLERSGIGIDFMTLAQIGTVDYAPKPIIPFHDHVFPTPSGKIEISSDRAEAAGLSRIPQPFVENKPNGDKLRLLSPSSSWLLNSCYGNDPKISQQNNPNQVFINPQEAKSRNLEVGSSVVLVNQTGRISLQIAISKDIPCGVALVYKGRWLKFDPSNANVNILNPGHKTDLGESTSVNSVEVDIVPVGVNHE
jgi:anaerobic selenocysteine-containing dehydrogenase